MDGKKNISVAIGAKRVERNGAPFIIAEIGVNHDGDVKVARRMVDAARETGADAVKFQLFQAKLLLAREAGLVEYQKKSAPSAMALLSELEISSLEMAALCEYARQTGLAAIITPFSMELVLSAVNECRADALKLASPDMVNRPLVEKCAGTELPVIISTGAASVEEIDQTMAWLREMGALERVILLHCVSSYPTPGNMATLGAISELRNRWPMAPVGYSDHTTLTNTGALAVCCGACVLEKHLTLDRKRAGPDHAASLEPADFASYVRAAREAYEMRGDFEKRILEIERPVREQTRQSVVLARNVGEGTPLEADDLTVKRPGTGIPAAGLRDLPGRKLVRNMRAGEMLQLADLDDPED